jgi:nitrogen fixation/metabolism regulation signal transduction histidine kinase
MAIARASLQTGPPVEMDLEAGDIVPAEVSEQIKTISVNETTKLIVHEIAPILGALRLYAREEVPNFDGSRTRIQVERLHQLLRALDGLSHAAVAPTIQEFDLAGLVTEVAVAEAEGQHVKVDLTGAAPLVVFGDPSLVRIALGNGIRNAVEAVQGTEAKTGASPVVVTWGDTDRDVWVAVLDLGTGPPIAVERAFEIGITTKQDHLGMGLATARQAIRSMSGTVSLLLRSETGGARFEIRWPKPRLTNP